MASERLLSGFLRAWEVLRPCFGPWMMAWTPQEGQERPETKGAGFRVITLSGQPV